MKNYFFNGQSLPQIFRVSILAFSFLCLCAVGGYAADIPIKGKVTDGSGEPLIGVSIQVKGANTGTASDLNGNYELSVPGTSAVLQFSYIGYVTKTEVVGSRTIINISLSEDNNLLDELVVVGYGMQRKANLTGAVGTVDVNKQLNGRPITDVGRGLQGSTPGLTITTTSGRIGQTPTIRIRGQVGSLETESLSTGGSKPLILVDGVEVSDLNYVNPDDIESISVLKDAASSSIYGTRAAFGVLLITTKSGKNNDKFSATYSNNFAYTSPTKLPKMAKSYESAAMALEAWQRSSPGDLEFGGDAGMKWDAEAIERMKEWDRNFGGMNLGPEMVMGRDFEVTDKGLRFYRTWDAFDMYIQNGFSQQHNLSVTGKSGNTNYHLGIGYMGNEGVLKANPDQYNRYTATFKTETEVNKWLKVRSQLMFSRTDLQTPFTYSTSTYDPLYYVYRWPVIYPYGTYNNVPFRSALAETSQANRNNDTKDNMRITLGGTLTLTKDLSLDADYSFVKISRLYQMRGGTVTAIDFWSGNPNNVQTYTSSSYDKYDQYNYLTDHHTANAILRYNKTFNNAHKLNAFAGWNLEYETYNMMNGEARGLLDPDKYTISMTEMTVVDGVPSYFLYGAQNRSALAGFFGRVNYSFKDRYLLELNGRYDGSSNFPLNQNWGFFPSASAGWILSEEAFMRSLQPALSFAKLRASFGSVGNPNIGADKFRAVMARNATSGWIVNKDEVYFGMPTTLANGFTWENIETRDLGLDLRFLNNDLGATFDLFRRLNKGMVTPGPSMPATFGAASPYMNIGELTTNGWEIGLDYTHSFNKDLRLHVNLNLADALTKVTKYPTTSKTLNGSNYKGRIIGEIWGYETDRYFTEADFAHDANGNRIYFTLDENGNKVYGSSGYSEMADKIPSQFYFEQNSGSFRYLPGDVKYKDLNHDGKIDRGKNTADDHGDMKIIGNTTPRYEFSGRIGLDYKGFDLDVFFQGVGKRNYWGSGNLIIPGFQFGDGVYYAHQTDYWTPDNPNAFYPRLTKMNQPGQYTVTGWNFLPQTKYLLNLAYCRLKNVTLGYSLPAGLLKQASIGKTRLYISLENLFEISGLGNIPIDPETNVSTGDGGTQGFGRIYPYTKSVSFGIQVTL